MSPACDHVALRHSAFDMAQTALVRKVPLGPSEATFVQRDDGAIVIRSPHALAPYPSKLTERLVHWARSVPERTFMAQRDAAGDWRTLGYTSAEQYRTAAVGRAAA